MISWNRLPHELQRAILSIVLMSGAAAVEGCRVPIVCDPAPPPKTSLPTAGLTPIVCDPAPPPSISPRPSSTAAASKTPVSPSSSPARTATLPPKPPIICDPAPPPSARAPISGQFQSLQIAADEGISGARVKGRVVGEDGTPRAGIRVELQSDGSTFSVNTDSDGTFAINCPPGAYRLVIAQDSAHSVQFSLKEHDVADVAWTLASATPGAMLPLAEIRTVDIVWNDDLTFTVETPWPGATYRWMATGGELAEEEGAMRWLAPDLPGRYLVQLIADWGCEGLAVDAITLTVCPDGTVVVS